MYAPFIRADICEQSYRGRTGRVTQRLKTRIAVAKEVDTIDLTTTNVLVVRMDGI